MEGWLLWVSEEKAIWELVISKGDLSEISWQPMQGMISGEMLGGICRTSHSGFGTVWKLFHSNEPLHPTDCPAKQGCFTADLSVHLLIVRLS